MYRDPIYRSILAQQPFRLIEGAYKAPTYDGYFAPVLPSPLLGGYRAVPGKGYIGETGKNISGYTYMPFTPVDRGGTANYVRVNEFAKSVVGMGAVAVNQEDAFAIQDEMEAMYNETVGLSKSISATIDALQPSAIQLLIEIGSFNTLRPEFEAMHKFYVSMANGLYEKTKAIIEGYAAIPDGELTAKQLDYYHNKYKALLEGHKKFQDDVNLVISDPRKYFNNYKDASTFNLIFKNIEDAGGSIGKTISNLAEGLFGSPLTLIAGGLAVYLLFFRKKSA
jgi:hypothetical protein